MKRSMLAGFPLRGELDWILASFHADLLESVDPLLCAISTVFSLLPRPALGYSSARDGLFKLSLTRREIHITMFLLRVSDHHLLKCPVIRIFEQYLECAETAMAYAVLRL